MKQKTYLFKNIYFLNEQKIIDNNAVFHAMYNICICEVV